MKKLLVITSALIVLGSVSANAASLNIGIGVPVYPEPVYAAPPPVYYAPQPVVAEPVYPEYVGGYYHVRPHYYNPRHREYDWRNGGYHR